MRVGGLASGMDTDSIVKQMMQIQKMPLDKLMQQKVWTEWQQEAIREQNLAFSNLRTSASNLRLQSTFNAYSAETTGCRRLFSREVFALGGLCDSTLSYQPAENRRQRRSPKLRL
ncbi:MULTISPECIES: flagellar cap protein FliD N-terminal domain-containing protein [unclassified Planococcus (in: firmicutes)]|uniref:flagellar cap protein FliD N-terminal domain-containing protein n=1 Tax=unclassified Planococcus (in: firmicutes) TaxID=2662419 RepID=UPI0027E52553|nr:MULTISPECIES: flagellar cap protein FliD N-terminal domain-containing protein [unclassified Planococcus (in: firmicutes)]